MNLENDEKEIQAVSENLKAFPSFDGAGLAQLIEDTGALVALRILARFKLSIEEAITSITTGIDQDNGEMVWKACHKLVGTAELIGFKEFGEKSRKLDSDVKAMPEIAAHIKDLEQYLLEAKEVLAQITTHFPRWKDYL